MPTHRLRLFIWEGRTVEAAQLRHAGRGNDPRAVLSGGQCWQTADDRHPLGEVQPSPVGFRVLPELDANRGISERDPDVGEDEGRQEHWRHAVVGPKRDQLAEPTPGVDDHRGRGTEAWNLGQRRRASVSSGNDSDLPPGEAAAHRKWLVGVEQDPNPSGRRLGRGQTGQLGSGRRHRQRAAGERQAQRDRLSARHWSAQAPIVMRIAHDVFLRFHNRSSRCRLCRPDSNIMASQQDLVCILAHDDDCYSYLLEVVRVVHDRMVETPCVG